MYYNIHKVLHEALRTEAVHEALRESLRTEALHRVPTIFLIASIRASAKYTPYIATLFFFYLSFLPYILPTREASEQQLVEDRR